MRDISFILMEPQGERLDAVVESVCNDDPVIGLHCYSKWYVELPISPALGTSFVKEHASESGGLIDAYRWEFQERKRTAEKAAYDLAHGNWNEVIRRRLVGFVDFRERESAPRLQDRARWGLYEELIEGADRAEGTSLLKRKAWRKSSSGS